MLLLDLVPKWPDCNEGHKVTCGITPQLSPAAVDWFSAARPSTGFQVHGRRRIFRCTAIDEFSGAQSPLPRLRSYGLTIDEWQLQCGPW